MKRLTKKKIALLIISIIVSIGVLYCVFWATLFFPDDIPLAIKEAEIPAPVDVSRVIDSSLIDNIDKAELSAGFSTRLINSSIDNLLKQDFLVKSDSYIRAARKNLIFRAGTGFPGVWVDERSSVIVPSGNYVSFPLRVKKNSVLEFSALSLGGAGLLEVKVSRGDKIENIKYELASYKSELKGSDSRMSRINRGFPRAKDDLGWRDYRVDLSKYDGKNISVSFSFNGNGATAFIGNPKVYSESIKRRYNVIYLVFDGVPTRLWSFYNPESTLTPFMKEAAEKEFTVFDNLFSLGDKTRISTSGLFCSVYPFMTRHGINRNFIPEREINLFYDAIRSDKLAALPDVFRRNGYTSAQFGNSGFTVQMLTTGVDYGFERSYEFSHNPYGAYGISHRFFDFLRVNKSREFFAYLHYNTPHKPFAAPLMHYAKAVIGSPLESLWRPNFMACVSYSDDVFKSIYAAIKTQGLLENTIIIVATDHGATYDLSKFQKSFQYNDFSRMTFMIHLPEALKKEKGISDISRVATYLSSINTAPTLCALAGLSAPKAFLGKSFVPVLSGSFTGNMFDKEIWCFGRKEFSVINSDLNKYMINHDEKERFIDRKYISFGEGLEVPAEKIYDLKNDPFEMNNLANIRYDLLAQFRRRVLDFDPHHPERNVISLYNNDSKSHTISVSVTSKSPIESAGLFTGELKEIAGLSSSGSVNQKSYSFKIVNGVTHFIVECSNDRAQVSFHILVDGVPVNAKNIFSSYLNTNSLGNPVSLNDRTDSIVLADINLPDDRMFEQLGRKGVSVKVLRLDLHRWIDIGQLESRGISSGMKETLRSWGYIQ